MYIYVYVFVYSCLSDLFMHRELNYRERVSTGWDSTTLDRELRRMQLRFRRARRMLTERLRGTATWDFGRTRYIRGGRQRLWSFQLSTGSRHRWEFLKHSITTHPPNRKNLLAFDYRNIINVVERSTDRKSFNWTQSNFKRAILIYIDSFMAGKNRIVDE